MSRVLLAWELGGNLGHLSRLLPLSLRLRERGHEVMLAVRDVALATEVLAPSGLRFVQAPIARRGSPDSAGGPASFADLLLGNGWKSPTTLWGLVQAWGNILRLFDASIIVLDHAPTALLSARILGLPCAAIGTGFELPPLTVPLPAFPGIAGDVVKIAAAAESLALANANQVLVAYGVSRVVALRDLFSATRRWLTTFAELDQYGPRSAEKYVGAIGRLDRVEGVDWPEGSNYRVLAYLRPETPGFGQALRVLAGLSDAAVICAAPGVAAEFPESMSRPGFQVIGRPVGLSGLFSRASLLVSYGSAATVTEALLGGVPQVILPAHVEAQMTAVRVQSLGAGIALRADASAAVMRAAVHRTLHDDRYKIHALEFACRYRGNDPAAALDLIAGELEKLAQGDAERASVARQAG